MIVPKRGRANFVAKALLGQQYFARGRLGPIGRIIGFFLARAGGLPCEGPDKGKFADQDDEKAGQKEASCFHT